MWSGRNGRARDGRLSKLAVARQHMRERIGEAFNNILSMLGGWTVDAHGKGKAGYVNREILKAVIEFAEMP